MDEEKPLPPLPEPPPEGEQPDFQTAFPNPADVLKLENPEGFESAFGGKTGLQPGEDGVIRCIHGCGRPAQFGNLRVNDTTHPYGQPGEPPRCSKNMSDCPVVNEKAIRAARRAGRLGRRWVSRF